MCVVYAWIRWDDDVVFKNQSRNEPKKERRFINDTIRNDFHRRYKSHNCRTQPCSQFIALSHASQTDESPACCWPRFLNKYMK